MATIGEHVGGAPADPVGDAPGDMVLTVACPTQRGIVAAVASFLARHGCNITDSAQFDDLANGRFFMRVVFARLDGAQAQEAIAAGIETLAQRFRRESVAHMAALRLDPGETVSRKLHKITPARGSVAARSRR